MPELFQDYWEAVARYREAIRLLDTALAAIAASSKWLTEWRTSNRGSMDLREWPSADRLTALISEHDKVQSEVYKLWHRFPEKERHAVVDPKTIDQPKK